MGNNFIFDKSFQLLRTNPLLTTNLQVVVNSDYSLYLETFNTNKSLSADEYKHFFIGKDSYLENKIPLFYRDLPANQAYDVKYDNDKTIMYNTYNQQFDEIYWAGANNISDQWHKEEYEYFAPLYIKQNSLPSNFIILRVDEPTIFNNVSQEYILDSLTKDNFKSEVIDKWKCVTNFDLTYQSDLGYWIDRNYTNNERFPLYPFELDVKEYNFSRWYGIDYNTGVYTEKDLYLKDKLWFENPHFNLETYITQGWKMNELVYPNILNLKFLFDDTPATPYEYKKYSMNRYYGFYLESLTLVKNITSYTQQTILSGITIKNNIFMLDTAITGSTNPFGSDSDWDDSQYYWLCAKNDVYKVYRNLNVNNDGTSYYQYGIICDYDLSITDFTNYKDNEADIVFWEDPTDKTNYKNIISGRTSTFNVDTYYDDTGENELYGDLYLININDVYHVLKVEKTSTSNDFYIQTDYGIRSTTDYLKYWIINEATENTTINMVDVLNNKDKPIMYPIYKAKFTEIRDFDFDRVNTHYADFDFEQSTYVSTPEHKLYTTEHLDDSYPKSLKVYPLGDPNETKTVIVSSEYISTDELFEINQFGLSDIWYKNPNICKWGFAGSNSHSDYPYKLNNNNEVGSTFNRTTDPYTLANSITDKTLDYFLRIGSPYSGLTDDIVNYVHQSIYVETESYFENCFNLDNYINNQFDYFDYFFKNTRYFSYDYPKNEEQTTKYSIFVGGDVYNNSYTLFKGLKYNIFKVNDLVRTTGKIEQIVTDSEINFNNYKFSAIINYQYSSTTYNTTTTDVYDSKGILSKTNNGIYVFLNEKYKNVLIIINYPLVTLQECSKINFSNVCTYDEKNGYYSGYDRLGNLNFNSYSPIKLCAANFINALNNLNDKAGFDQYAVYYYIGSDSQTGYTYMGTDNTNYEVISNIYNVSTWKKNFSPFVLNIELPTELKLKLKSYNVVPIKGPKYNIYDKYKTDYTEIPYNKTIVSDPLARYIDIDEKEIKPQSIEHGEDKVYDKQIFRYNGPYEPIFKEIELFDKVRYFYSDDGIFSQTKYTYRASQQKIVDVSTYNPLISEDQNEQVMITSPSIEWLEDSLDDIDGSCNNIGALCEFNIDNTALNESPELYIDYFNFNLPSIGATITDIEVNISQRSLQCNIYDYIYCSYMYLNVNGNDVGVNISGSSTHTYPTPLPAYSIEAETGSEWGEYTFHGSPADWGYSALTTAMVNMSDFGLGLKYTNIVLTPNAQFNSVEIDCINIKITYTVNSIPTGATFFASYDRNYKFNTNLTKFGEIEELLCSKVNHVENVLKIQYTEEDLSIYPMVDEYGYIYTSRFIFKSTWDKDYYIQTYNINK